MTDRSERIRAGPPVVALCPPACVFLLLAGAFAPGGCAPATPAVEEPSTPAADSAAGSAQAVGETEDPAHLLYVWMGDVDRDPETGELSPGQDSDFLAVYDIDPRSPSYGDVVSTLPVGLVASMPHHTEYWMPEPGQPLFANAHLTEDILRFDLTDPSTPRLAGVLDPVPPLRFPHDIVALPNGNVVVGYLRSEGPSPLPGDSQLPGGHGGLAEFTRSGELVRWASAADSSVTEPVRPYSFAPLPEIDRLVVTSAPMMESHSADVVQVWRLSDLTLLRTLSVPPARLADGSVLRTQNRRTGVLEPTGHTSPFVPRVMHDGSVLFNAFGCGLYRISGLEGENPTVENVYTFDVADSAPIGACGIPVYTGRYWVMAVGAAHTLVTLDVENPAEPRRVARLPTGADFVPHWLSLDPDSHRLIVGAEGSGEVRMLMAHLDPATGELTWDETLRERNGFPGIDFRRESWPHGETGLAFAHAAVFERRGGSADERAAGPVPAMAMTPLEHAYASPPEIGDGWRVASAAEVGLDPDRLAEMTASVHRGDHGNVHAILIEKAGRLVYEEYFTGRDESWGVDLGEVTFGRASLHDLRSAAKSVVSTLIGIAIGSGEIPSADARVLDLLPEYAALLDGEKAEIRLRDVLSMSAGLEWDEWSQPYSHPQNDWQQLTRAADPVAFLLDRELVDEPGSTFTYNTGLTYLLAEILKRATGEQFDAYARRLLFEPMGIRDVVWLGRISGRTPPADAGLRLRARDFAKLGSLFLNEGRWNGLQIVPEPWIAEAPVRRVLTPPLEPVPDFGLEVGYGYQWWNGRYATSHGEVDVHIMLGNGQQRVMVVPELSLAVTMFAGHYDDPNPEIGWMPDRLLVEYVIDALRP